ncbi:MAG: DMT family transporter [Vicinamibacterales bacterium]
MIDSLLIVLPGLIWGASFLFIAEGLEAVSPTGVAFVRILVGFLTLSVVPAVRRPILRGDRTRIALLGVIWMAFPLNMFPFAEQHVSSALAGMLNGSVPLFVAAVAGAIARRAPSRAVLVGLLVGFLGAILIALPGLTAGPDGSGQTIGVLLILAALVSYGFAYSLSGPLQQRNGALPVIWRALGVAVVLTAPLGVPSVLAGHWSFWPVVSLVALGAGGTGIAYVMTATAAGRMGATVASINNFFIPVVALALGVYLRHEQVSWISIVGAAVCLLGAWLIRQAKLADEHRAATKPAFSCS